MDRDIIIGILESINNNDQMNYINVFINELCNKYKCIDLAYIPLIESDRWYIHDYHLDKIGFFSGSLRKDITTKLDQYKLGLPIIDDIATLFPEERSANRILTEGTIQNFYKHFIPKVRNHMLSIHQKWHHHVIAPLTLKDHLYGHIILCIKNETTAADKNTLIHDLEDYRILLSICLASENEKPCTHIYEEILKTTLSLGSTSVLTGFVSKSFLSQLFRLAIKVIPEADYGSAILISNGLWIFDDAIGHDIEQLKKIPISRDIYEKNMSFVNNSQEIEPGVFLIDSILQRHNETGVYNPIFSEINKASKPIKTSMQVHITNKGFLFGIISLDISPNNPLSFSRESARVLKQIGSIASLLFGYNTIFNYTESFCNITDLIANYVLKKATIKCK